MTRTKALLVVIGLLALSAGYADWQVFRLGASLSRTIHQQARGRHFAVGVTCATLSAISEAGREVIAGAQQPQDTPFVQALERLGYPPFSVRHKQAQTAAVAYVDSISARVQQQVGGRAAKLVRPNGTIDCSGLQRLSNTAVGR